MTVLTRVFNLKKKKQEYDGHLQQFLNRRGEKKQTKKKPLNHPRNRCAIEKCPDLKAELFLCSGPASRTRSKASRPRETTPAIRPHPLIAPLSHARARVWRQTRHSWAQQGVPSSSFLAWRVIIFYREEMNWFALSFSLSLSISLSHTHSLLPHSHAHPHTRAPIMLGAPGCRHMSDVCDRRTLFPCAEAPNDHLKLIAEQLFLWVARWSDSSLLGLFHPAAGFPEADPADEDAAADGAAEMACGGEPRWSEQVGRQHTHGHARTHSAPIKLKQSCMLYTKRGSRMDTGSGA